MVMEPKGEKVGALEDVSTNGLCTSAVHERAAADDDKGNVYGMKTCNHHESKRTDWNSLLKSFPAGTFSRQHGWVFVGPCHPCAHGPPALLSGGNGNSGIEPFGTGGDTHTHRAVFGAVSPSKVVVRPGASSSVLTPRRKRQLLAQRKNY